MKSAGDPVHLGLIHFCCSVMELKDDINVVAARVEFTTQSKCSCWNKDKPLCTVA